MGSEETDVHALSLSYEPEHLKHEAVGRGGFGLAVRGADGRRVNAVAQNVGGKPTYVKGAYREGYPLGTYGVDPAAKTAWAVLNHSNAAFTVTNFDAVEKCK